MEFLLFIAVVILAATCVKMSGQIEKLKTGTRDEHLDTRTQVRGSTIQQAPAKMYPDGFGGQTPLVTPQTSERAYVPQQQMYNNVPPSEDAFLAWIKQDFLMKIGGFFLLVGIGWFVTYAMDQGWIGPVGRITLGIVFGACVLILGAWRIKTYEHQGAIFTVLGSTIIILTVTTGRVYYKFFDPYTSLALTLLSIIFVTFISLKYRRNSLAIASLILALLAPYFSGIYAEGINEFFSYLLVVILGTLWVVYKTTWRNLTLIASLATFFLSFQYIAVSADQAMALLWVFIFTGIFFIANIVSLIRQEGGTTSETNLASALVNALFLVIWVFAVAPKENQSMLFVAWAIVFAVGSYIVFRSTSIRAPFYVYGGTSVALIGAATAAELDGAALAIAFTFEIAVLVVVAILSKMHERAVTGMSCLFAFPMIYSLGSITSSSWRGGIMHADFFFLLILMLVLLIVGLFMRESLPSKGGKDVRPGTVPLILGFLYGLTLVWLVAHALLDNGPAISAILITYMCIGIPLYFIGRNSGSEEMKIGGGALITFVVVRLILIDVWRLPMEGRIITFIVVGILLLSTAFIQKKHKAVTTPTE